MANAVIAFKDYNVVQGIWGSAVGRSRATSSVLRTTRSSGRWCKNTFLLSVYAVLASFPIPIILALALNEVRQRFFKRTVQMVTYAPYFISTVVVVSMTILFLSPRLGLVATSLGFFGVGAVDFLGDPDYFRHIYVWSRHLADRGLLGRDLPGRARRDRPVAVRGGPDRRRHPAAEDLARRPARDLPTAVIILVLGVGNIMAIGFEKAFLLQNPLNLSPVGDHRDLRLQDRSAQRRLQPGDRDRAVQLGDQPGAAARRQLRRQAGDRKRTVVT